MISHTVTILINSIFTNVGLHIIVSFISTVTMMICGKTKAKSDKEEDKDRQPGGIDEKTFVPPHIGQNFHPRSIFKVNQVCPAHGNRSESLDESWLSKLDDESTHISTASVHEKCICFRIPKRVRFAFPSTTSTTSSTIFAGSDTPTKY